MAKLFDRMLTAQQNAVHNGASSMFAVPHRTRREDGFSHTPRGKADDELPSLRQVLFAAKLDDNGYRSALGTISMVVGLASASICFKSASASSAICNKVLATFWSVVKAARRRH